MELKAFDIVVAEEGYCEGIVKYRRAVYYKSEADKVIAELEMKLAAVQQVLRLNTPEALYSNLETMSRLSHKIHIVERRECHQKYKRCLAMAWWCARYLRWVEEEFGASPYYNFYERWHKRWLELAEKFKEVK